MMDCSKSYLNHLECYHELERAIVNAKLERISAKPLLSVLEHRDSVTCVSQTNLYSSFVITGSADGQIQLWDTKNLNCFWQSSGHKRTITGLVTTHTGASFVSCSLDHKVLLWKILDENPDQSPYTNFNVEKNPYWGKHSFTGVDHHWINPYFITVGSIVEIWEHSRRYPVQSYNWGPDTFTCVRINPIETDLCAACSTDRNIFFYDLRTSVPIERLVMTTLSIAIAWNPIDILSFTTANDDSNLYTFDIRRLKSALLVHKDFVSSVLDVNFSSKGHEFVAGSLDRSVRIFAKQSSHSREIYHTERMQRVMTVKFTIKDDLILSGSDDMNLRIWESNVSNHENSNGTRNVRAYNRALMSRYRHLKHITTILKNRFIPKPIFFSSMLKRKELKKLDSKRTYITN